MNRTSYDVRLADSEVNRPAGPPESRQSDHQQRLKLAQQIAQRDAASGMFDPLYFEQLGDDLLPAELDAQRWLERARADAEHARSGAESVAMAREAIGGTDISVRGPGLPRGYTTTLDSEIAELEETETSIDAVEARRNEALEILRGNAGDAEGITWVGDPPPKPRPSSTKWEVIGSAVNLRNLAQAWFTLLVLGLAEAGILVPTLMAYVRTDYWIMPAAMAVAALVGLILLPKLIGETLARVYRRGFAVTKEVFAVAAMSLMWLGVVFATAWFRLSVDRAAAIAKLATETKVPIPSIDPDQAYDIPSHLAQWLLWVSILGVVAIAVTVFSHNPVVRTIIRGDLDLLRLYRDRSMHRTIIDKATAQLEAQRVSVLQEWNHYITETLPTQFAEYCSEYRHWLSIYLGSPSATNGLYPKGALR